MCKNLDTYIPGIKTLRDDNGVEESFAADGVDRMRRQLGFERGPKIHAVWFMRDTVRILLPILPHLSIFPSFSEFSASLSSSRTCSAATATLQASGFPP